MMKLNIHEFHRKRQLSSPDRRLSAPTPFPQPPSHLHVAAASSRPNPHPPPSSTKNNTINKPSPTSKPDCLPVAAPSALFPPASPHKLKSSPNCCFQFQSLLPSRGGWGGGARWCRLGREGTVGCVRAGDGGEGVNLNGGRRVINYNKQISMEGEANNLFHKVARKARKIQYFQNILEIQENKLDFRPYGIEKLTPEKAVEVYNRVLRKYSALRRSKVSAEVWYESEKRLFVWFMVLYTYFYRSEPARLLEIDYPTISLIFFNKDVLFLEFHYLTLIKTCEKVAWTDDQDRMLLDSISLEGMRWSQVSKRIFTITERGLFRAPKHCRERWINHLDDSKVHGNWSDLEDYLIFEFVVEREGKRWSRMVSVLNFKRTEHMIKNRYNSLITRDRLSKQERETETARRTLEALRQTLGKERVYFNAPRQPRSSQSRGELSQKESELYEREESLEGFGQEDHPRNCQEGEIVEERNEEEEEGVRLKEENASEEHYHSYKVSMNEEEPRQECSDHRMQSEGVELGREEENQCMGFNPYFNEGEGGEAENGNNTVYPFENYSYEMDVYSYANGYGGCNNQIYEFHKNQIVFYQPVFYTGIPTADTFVNTAEREKLEQEQAVHGNALKVAAALEQQQEYNPQCGYGTFNFF